MNKKLITTGILTFSIFMMFLALLFPSLEVSAQKDGRLRIAPVRPQEEPFVPEGVLVKFRLNIWPRACAAGCGRAVHH